MYFAELLTCSFFFNSAKYRQYIYILIFKHLSAKNVTKIVEENFIQLNQRGLRVYIGSIDKKKSPFVYSLVFWVDETLNTNQYQF